MTRRQINLFQAEFRPRRVVLPARALLLHAGVFALLLGALHAWDAWRLVGLRREVDQAVAQAEAMARKAGRTAPPAAADPALLKDAAALEARARALQSAQALVAGGALGAETGYADQFRALARARMPGAWLTRVELAGGGRELNLRGRALDGAAPARLIAGLRREPLFRGLNFATLEVHPPEPKPGQAADQAEATPPRFLEFALMARLPEPPAKPAANPQPQPVTAVQLLETIKNAQ